MSFIPRQVKPPARIAVTCKLPQHVATLLKGYAEFLDSSQEYVVSETLQLAFRRDREFQAWLTATEMATALAPSPTPSREPSDPTPTHTRTEPATARRGATTAPAAPRPTVDQER